MSDTDKVWLWLIGIVVVTATTVGWALAGFDATVEVVGTVVIFVMALVSIGVLFTWLDRRSR